MPRRNRPKKSKIPTLRAKYVQFWPEGTFDTTPFIVRLLEQDGESVYIAHPEGYKLWTHIHNIGRAA